MRKFEKVSLETFKKFYQGMPDEIIKKIYDSIKMPERKTKFSAGYDIYSPIDIVLSPLDEVLIPTGIKALMNDDEFLSLYIRSSLGIKKDLMLKNQVAVIDKDYYNNPDNEGHIMISVKNTGLKEVTISSNEAIAQGIFMKYLVTDDDHTNNLRKGGIGSTTNLDIKLEKVKVKDSHELLAIQKKCFEKYVRIYGEFDSNPYNMTLHRMEFNIKYHLGDYQKIMLNDQIIGGIFGFKLEDEGVWQLGQFYILPEYENKGLGTQAINMYFDMHQDVKTWYADTILQESNNMKFYKKIGFETIDIEEEHQGLSFVTLVLNRK